MPRGFVVRQTKLQKATAAQETIRIYTGELGCHESERQGREKSHGGVAGGPD